MQISTCNRSLENWREKTSNFHEYLSIQYPNWKLIIINERKWEKLLIIINSFIYDFYEKWLIL